jgi:DNA-binding beta-propeller fold protein YncE
VFVSEVGGTSRRRWLTPGRALVLAVVLAAPLMGSADALATTGHSFADQFGAAGGGAGEFAAGGPAGVAVDQASGDVFVGDPGHMLGDGTTPDPRVERFAASGAYESSFAIDAAAYNSATQLAVDPAGSGSVYVSTGAGTVVKYSLAGVLAHALDTGTSGTSITPGAGVAVDPSTGTVYVMATDTTTGAPIIDSFDGGTGAFVSSFAGADSAETALCFPTSAGC